MSQSKAASVRVTAAERKLRAVELRKLGFTYQKIADQLGVSVAAAHKMVTRALRELNERTAESAEELRQLELERLDEWLLKVAQEIQAGRVLGGIDRGLRILERRARLLGLEAPVKAEIAGPGGGPIEIEDARQRLTAMIERRVVAMKAAEVAPRRRLASGVEQEA